MTSECHRAPRLVPGVPGFYLLIRLVTSQSRALRFRFYIFTQAFSTYVLTIVAECPVSRLVSSSERRIPGTRLFHCIFHVNEQR
jgi:hypothetical protein